MRPISLTLALVATLAVQGAAAPPEPGEFARYTESVLADAFPADAPGVAVLAMRGDEVLRKPESECTFCD